MTDEKQTVSLFSCTGEEDVTCICGKSECTNNRNVAPLENLSHKRDEHKLLLHQALKKLDCATVCQLLHSGMQFCFFGKKSCISIIAKYWTPASLDLALTFYPSAINCRGPKGETLLMMCRTPEKFQTVLDHGADVNATNDDDENVLLYNIKHLLKQPLEEISKTSLFSTEGDWNKTTDLAKKFQKLLILMVNSGVNMDAEDKQGQTAVQFLLQIFKPGPSFDLHPHYCVAIFNLRMCFNRKHIACIVLFYLLQSGARLPSPDQHGRTPLMLALQCPFNDVNLQTMIERGVDVHAVDIDGNNAMHYMLASIVQEKDMTWYDVKISKSDQMVSFLLDRGCQMQGTDILISKYGAHYKVFNYLMAQDTSTLRQRNFSHKLEMKNDSINVSFLSLYMKNRTEDEFGFSFKSSDVSFIRQEIESGLDVNCGAHLFEVPEFAVWKKKLALPYPLVSTIFYKLRQPVYNASCNEESDEKRITELKKSALEHHQAVEAIQKLLLPFWSHTPLALLLFVERDQYTSSEETEVLLLKRLAQFLYEVGGPLSPGSEIYHGVKEHLKTIAVQHPAYGELVSFFNDLHSEVPRLLQLARTTLRANLKKTDTRGLDVSSLKALCQGDENLINIEGLINFRKSSVSVMQDVPLVAITDESD